MKNKETRGGKREGAGRPKSKPTKTLSYRVPASLANKLDKEIRQVIEKIKPHRRNGRAKPKPLLMRKLLSHIL